MTRSPEATPAPNRSAAERRRMLSVPGWRLPGVRRSATYAAQSVDGEHGRGTAGRRSDEEAVPEPAGFVERDPVGTDAREVGEASRLPVSVDADDARRDGRLECEHGVPRERAPHPRDRLVR